MRQMIRTTCYFGLGLACVLAVGSVADAQTGSKQAAEQATQTYRPITTLARVMESVIMPTADVLWNAVAVNVTSEGTETTQPETDEDWEHVRGAAITLIEMANALMVPGRHVDVPGAKSEAPDSELSPEQIQQRFDRDRAIWVGFAHGLQDASIEALKAINAKDVNGLSDAGGTLDTACENCHLYFWYPEQTQQQTQ